MTPLLTAFLGASVAFVFFLLGQAILKAYDKARDHLEALVRIERLLNDHLDIVHVHINQIGTLRRNIESGHLLIDLPRNLPIDENAGFHLLDIVIINKLMSLWTLGRRINNDVENLRAAYGQIAGLFLGGRVQPDGYIKNASFVVSGFETVAKGLDTYKTETEEVLARVRLHFQRRQPMPMRFVGFLTRRVWVRLGPIEEAAVRKELAQMAEEVKLVRARGPATQRQGEP